MSALGQQLTSTPRCGYVSLGLVSRRPSADRGRQLRANTGRRKMDGPIMRDDKDSRDRRLRYRPTHAIVINSALD
jgi:hypothetical protein